MPKISRLKTVSIKFQIELWYLIEVQLIIKLILINNILNIILFNIPYYN